MSIRNIEHRGVLIHECDLDGERRMDSTVPAHPNGIQVSRNRWLLVYATRRFRGNDDDCSIVYQLRADRPDGPLIREGMLAQATEDWQPDELRTGRRYKKEHRSPAAFGVPKGARINGREAPQGNVFVIRWGTVAREFEAETKYVRGTDPDPDMVARTQAVEWVQVKLNETEDDIVPIRPVEKLRQVGYETGKAICSVEDVLYTQSSRTQAVPYNDDCTEWIENGHFDGGRFAVRKYRYNAYEGFYEWTETGPFIFDRHRSEGGAQSTGGAQLVKINGGWVVGYATTTITGHVWQGRGLGWIRLDDPFEPLGKSGARPEPIRPPEPATRAPANFYLCPDGVLRCFSGDGTHSPYANERDPLYCWDIDPDNGFKATNRRVIYDTVEAGLPIRREAQPKIDMCKLLPPQGSVQYLVHRLSITSMYHQHVHTRPEFWTFPPMNKAEMESCGIYYATIEYDDVLPPPWQFAAG